MTVEELAQWLEQFGDVIRMASDPANEVDGFSTEHADAIAKAAARLRELSRDGERLERLAKGYVVIDATTDGIVLVEDHDIHSQDVDVYTYEGQTIRAAIDQAMEKKG